LCREEQLLLRFFGEGLRQVQVNRASLAKWGAESAGRLFSLRCSSASSSADRSRSLISPAPIPDPSMICACSVSKKKLSADFDSAKTQVGKDYHSLIPSRLRLSRPDHEVQSTLYG
jgi:hypothetical protein